MQIDEVAYLCQTSAASVVRLSKRMGYLEYKDLCRALSVDLALQKAERSYEDMHPDSSLAAIARSACRTDIEAIENTLSMCDYDEMEKAVAAMVRAKRIDFYGVGSSNLVARDGSNKFLRLAKICLSSEDPHYQLVTASTLGAEDVAVLISYTGTTFDTLETMRMAKDAGAVTISITKYGDTPLSSLADIRLYADNSESLFRSGAMRSRIGQLAVIDILFTAVASRMYGTVKPHLEQTQEILNRKRIHMK